jgi:glycine/serine hydroxymethyltransferase
MKEKEMDVIADLIFRALQKIGDTQALAGIGNEVRDLCSQFPIYKGRLQSV